MKKIALAMICKGTEKESKHLANCLKYIAPHVDKIFITITGGDEPKPVEEVCKKFKAEVSYATPETTPKVFGLEYSEETYEEYKIGYEAGEEGDAYIDEDGEFQKEDWQYPDKPFPDYNAWVEERKSSKKVFQHFAEARNYNFSQVPKEYDYIAWFDADDAVRNADKIRETVKDNPDIDIFQFMYLYAFDEDKNPIVVHPKGRIIRNDGCVEWVGALHEDFKQNRKVSIKLVEGIDVLHLSSHERFEEAKVRNLEVAEAQMKELPNDPRSYWNVGNSLKALLRDVEAIQMFDKFIEMSKSEDEKYVAFLRMVESYWNLGMKDDAIKTCKYAIGTKPAFPDAYHLLGDLYLEMNKNQEAIEQYLHGLHKKPPYYEILVFNPRDYDYRPMMNMAKAYFNLQMPTMALPLLEACAKIMPSDKGLKEKVDLMKAEAKRFDEVAKIVEKLRKIKDKDKIRKELDKIEDEYQSHPAICNIRNTTFIKKESSGKDLVFYCGYTEREWTPESVKEGIGGSEEAIIHLAQGLADKGWNVTVYNNCGHKEKLFVNNTEINGGGCCSYCDGTYYDIEDDSIDKKDCPKCRGNDDGSGSEWDRRVIYKPFWTWNYRDKQDVVVIWRHALPLDYEINADKVFLDLHDVIQPGELNEKRMDRCTGVFVKSKFHRSLFPDVADDKFIVVPNGIISETFENSECINCDGTGKESEDICELCKGSGNIVHQKDPMLMINTSSPDRSLKALIDCFRIVKKEVPEAKCKWCYGWGVWDTVYASDKEAMDWKANIQKELKEVGIEELGMISHQEVAKLYKRATILAYPSEFAEIDCISVSKALASGCIPVTTNFAAMGEKSTYGGVYIESKKTKDTWCRDGQISFSMESNMDKWIKETVKILKGDKPKLKRDKVLKDFNWDNITERWNKTIC